MISRLKNAFRHPLMKSKFCVIAIGLSENHIKYLDIFLITPLTGNNIDIHSFRHFLNANEDISILIKTHFKSLTQTEQGELIETI